VALARLVEQPSLRGSADCRTPGGVECRRVRIQVGEDLLDDARILNARDDALPAAAGRTGLDVDPENPLEALRLRLIAARRSAGALSSGSAVVARRPPLPRLAGVTRARYLLFGAKTPWKRVRLTRGLGTKAASRAMKSSGSKITYVVPSRYGVFN